MRTTLHHLLTASLLFSSWLPASDAHAQTGSTCGTDALLQHWRQASPDALQHETVLNTALRRHIEEQRSHLRGGGDPVLYVPVVVHIIHGNGPENIADATVQQGIQHLNQAFANAGPYARPTGVDIGIRFCLAQQDTSGMPTTGITRMVSPLTDMTMDTDDGALKALVRWDPTRYLNIWLVKSITSVSTGPGVAGYAYFPSSHGAPEDGIVNEAAFFGSSTDNSKVHIHEAGHYLGLYHTFEGGCTNNDCMTDGDHVCDTPPDGSTQAVPCGTTANTCTTDADDASANNPFRAIALGGLGPQNDLYQDYMDYGLQQCQDRYTAGQRERMRAALSAARASLLTSPGCSTGCGISILDLGLPDNAYLIFGNTMVFAPTLLGVSTVTYQWLVDGNPVSTAATYGAGAVPVGDHTITLVLTNTAGACSVEKTITVHVRCSVPLGLTRTPLHPEPGQATTFSTWLDQGITAQWMLDGQPAGSGTQFTHTFATSGFHSVYAISSNGSCTDTSDAMGFLVGSCPSAYDRNWHINGPENVNFLTSPPNVEYVPSDPAFFANEGSATLSDDHGDVIIYSNGISVWDRTLHVMQNGDSLLGGASSTQSALIVPNPSNNGIHYLFTTDHFAGLLAEPSDGNLRYNVIDLALNGGNGAVTQKNVFLMGPSTEKLAAVRHCNGHDTWVVAHQFDSDAFYCYLITDAGLNTTPLVQHVGKVHVPLYSWGEGGLGQTAIGALRFSQQGDMLAITSTKGEGFAQVFHFDAETGAITDPLTIRGAPTDSAYYAVEFSPNGRNLYLSTENPNGLTGGRLYQYKLDVYDSAAVALSGNPVIWTPFAPGPPSLILAPDDRIYVGIDGRFRKMSHPDVYGACGFNYNDSFQVPGLSLGVTNNVVRNRTAERISASGPLHVCNYTEGVEYTIDACAHPANTRWIYHGPNTVVADTYQHFVLDFHVAGRDTLIAVRDNGCEGLFTDTLFIQVDLQLPLLPADTALCAPVHMVLSGGEGYASYHWQDGSSDPTLAIDAPGTYSLTVTALGGCSLTDQVVVTAFPNTLSLSLGNDTTVCYGGWTSFTAPAGLASYHWSTGSTTNTTSISIGSVTTLSLQVTDANGCTAQDSVVVTPLYDGPYIELGPDLELCPGEVLVLDPQLLSGSVATWRWEDFSAAPTHTVWQPGTYWVTATSPCGYISVDTVHVTVCVPTGVNAVAQQAGIGLAPNPTNGDVHIALPGDMALLTVEVLDMLGHVVLRSSGEDRTLHLQSLASGVYSVRLSTSAGAWMARVVRE